MLLERAQLGQSGVLVLRGEDGIGKSTLLDYTGRHAAAFRVERAVGARSETAFPFAGLHQLCAPMLDRLERLPAPQRNALSTAFGMGASGATDGFLVSLAVLGLFSEVAAERPLLCLVDDAHWLDGETLDVVSFVSRRLQSQACALVLAVREPSDVLAGLPELVVERLSRRESQDLFAAVIAAPVEGRVRDQIVAETRGNPRALLSLARGLDMQELAGGFGLATALPVPDQAKESMRRQLETLTEQGRRLLLVAAAEPSGDAALLWRASTKLGIDVEETASANTEGLLEFGPRVLFRDPLARAAIYRSSSPSERRRAHAALAEAIDPDVDADWRVWHRTHAAPAPDEQLGDDLAQAARQPHLPGGLPAKAAFLDLASAMTPDPARRAQLELAAAEANHLAGLPEASMRLLGRARATGQAELTETLAGRLELQIVAALSRDEDTPLLLAELAKRLEPLDAEHARDTYLDAFSAALLDGRFVDGSGTVTVARAVCASACPPPRRACDTLLDGVARLIVGGYLDAAAPLRQALESMCGATGADTEGARWLPLACQAALLTWDEAAWQILSDRQLEWARAAGALTRLPAALAERIAICLRMGDLATATALVDELQAASAALRDELTPSGALALAAWRGYERDAAALIDFALGEVEDTGEERRLPAIHAARAVLYNGLGRYEEALRAASQASEQTAALRLATPSLAELVEAASRCGAGDVAAAALDLLAESTRSSGSEWALGTEARARALLCSGEEAERLYQEALARLAGTQLQAELARAHLVYGEWLRREQRRVDARNQLRIAEEMFAQMGFAAFTKRAERELVATGETARKRSVETRGQLTPQESEIARIACEGLSNPEIGSRLFISPRTVEWHLHKIYVKLAIRSRKELRVVMASSDRKRAVASSASWSELAGVAALDAAPRRAATLPRPAPLQRKRVA